MENESEGCGEWRMRARDRGEWRMRARDGESGDGWWRRQ